MKCLMSWVVVVAASGLLFSMSVRAQGEEAAWAYLDNGRVRLGVNLQAGACIGWFSASGAKVNLLNAYDVGRYVQQSYYGDEDGSDWNGKPWRYNPVQGGSWRNEPAVVLESKVDAAKHELYAKTRPRHWATGKILEEVTMEQWLRLDGELARMKFRMSYTGTKTHQARHQELPALFVSPTLDTLVSSVDQGRTLAFLQPGFPNERLRFQEPWLAWVNAKDEGIGLWCAHTSEATSYRVRNGNKGDCSYVAPIRTFELKPGLVFDYETALMLGSVEEIRAVCRKLTEAARNTRMPEENDMGEVRKFTQKNSCVEAVLTVPKVSRIDGFQLSLTLRNCGKENLSLFEPDGQAPIEFEIKRSDGLHLAQPPLLPLPDPKADLIDQFFSQARLRAGSGRRTQLKPGESRLWKVRLKIYVPLEAGTYRLKLQIDELDAEERDRAGKLQRAKASVLPPFEGIELVVTP